MNRSVQEIWCEVLLRSASNHQELLMYRIQDSSFLLRELGIQDSADEDGRTTRIPAMQPNFWGTEYGHPASSYMNLQDQALCGRGWEDHPGTFVYGPAGWCKKESSGWDQEWASRQHLSGFHGSLPYLQDNDAQLSKRDLSRSAHELRAVAASLAYSRGASLKELMSSVGWSSTATVGRFYLRQTTSIDSKSAPLVDRTLGNHSKTPPLFVVF
jgi:hypothetical protein